ncbi:MAG TPA: hypothetical protein PK867_13060 [Pirellulales bacterium]|nr:hypothetical protein [Pirellulales bacterium]
MIFNDHQPHRVLLLLKKRSGLVNRVSYRAASLERILVDRFYFRPGGGARACRTPDDRPFEDVIRSERTPRAARAIASHPSLKPPLRMGQGEPADKLREFAFLPRPDEQVPVVWQQALGQQSRVGPPDCLGQNFLEGIEVALITVIKAIWPASAPATKTFSDPNLCHFRPRAV